MADLAGTAAIRLVPSLTGFRQRAKDELRRQQGIAVDVDIRPKIDTSTAKRQLERFRAKERADAINLKVKVDEADFKRQFQRVEHVFERSAFAKALRLQIKVVGLDALYAVATAGAAAAASIDTVAKAAVILPGALSAAGVAAGVFALALQDVSKAITAVQTEQDQAADKARALAGAQADAAKASRDVGRASDDVRRAHEGVGRAVRQAIRDYEDLAHAVRGTSLDEADALLNVQESFDRLREGGFKSLTELRRAQLDYARDLHALDGVRTQNKRTLEDYNEAQRKGLAGSDQVVAAQDRMVQALDAVQDAQNRVADAASRMADATQTKTMTGAYARLAPAAKEFVDAITNANGAWVAFGQSMQQGVFEGQVGSLERFMAVLHNMQPEMEGVAHQIGGVFIDISNILSRSDIQGMLQGIVRGTGATIGTLRQGLEPLIAGFLRMADIGVRHLPQLVDVFNRLWERFDAFTQRAAADGTLDRWIDNGIKGFEQLLHVGENLIGIVADVANAWRMAGGESTGLIGNAEQLTTEIRNWTSSTAGQNSMADQFRKARDWLSQVWTALQNIWPTMQGIIQTAREWSAMFLTVLGWAAKLTSWVQEHTGLVKLMVGAYLTIRTVKPLWDILSNAASAYSNILLKQAALGRSWAESAVAGQAQFQTALGKSNTNAQLLTKTFETQNDRLRQMFTGSNDLSGSFERLSRQQAGVRSSMQGALAPTNDLTGAFRNANPQLSAFNSNMVNAASPIRNMGTSAATAAGQVGSKTAGLWGAMAGLGAMLGPMAIAMVATGGIIWAIDKMGEAHRKAAAEAQNQKNQLDALKNSLDQFSGAFTAQTAIDTSKQAQDFQTTAFGKRNILQDIVRTGVASPEALIGATNPVNEPQRRAIAEQLRQGAAGKLAPVLDREIVGSGGIKTTQRKQMAALGLNEQDLIGILTGDQAAIDKWTTAVKNQPGGEFGPESLGGVEGQKQAAQKNIPPEAWDYLTSLQFLNTTSGAYVAGGQQNQFGTTAAFGEAKLKAGIQGYGSAPEVRYVAPDLAQIVITEPPADPAQYVKDFPADVGSATVLPGGRIQINLTREATARDVERKAEGGMIRGVGSGTSDSNMIAASRGEYIVRKAAVNAVGVQNLDRINSLRFAFGGVVPGFFPGGMPFPLTPPTVPPAPIVPPAPATPPVAPYTPTVPTTPAPAPTPAPTPPATPPVSVPAQYPALPAPTTSMPYSPTMTTPSYASTQLPPNMGPGPMGPIPVQTDTMDDTIASYLTGLARQNGLRVGALSSDPEFNARFGAGTHDNDGGWHPNHRALDIGNGPDTLGLAQWWIQDPARVASTKELILNVPGWDTNMNIKDGKFVRDYGGGVYDEGTLAGHGDHMHLALGQVPNSQGQIMINGQPVSYPAYSPTVQYDAQGMPIPGSGTTGSGYNDSNLSLSDRIAKRYEDAFKPENVNKFLFGQAEKVGQSMMAIGIQFLSGLTGLDIGSVYGPAQQIMSHFAGSDSKGGGDSSSLQAGSPMDNQISGDINSFFDPWGGQQGNIQGMVNGAAGSQHGNVSLGPGPDAANKKAIAQYIYNAGIQAGLAPEEAVALVAYAIGESGLDPGISGGVQSVPGSPGGDADTVIGLFQQKPAFAQAGGVDPALRNTVQGNVQAYINNLLKHRGEGDIFDQLLATSQGGPMHTGGREAMAGLMQQAKGLLGFRRGGFTGGVPARVSRGEYRMSPKAVRKYGVGFMNQVNAAGYAGGGIPFAQGVVLPPMPKPPLPRGPQAQQIRPTPGANQNGPVAPPVQAPGPAPVAGVPAPAPAPVAPPPPAAGAGGVQNVAPVPQGPNMVDPAMAGLQRGMGVVGAAPTSNTHLAQGVKGAIEGGFQAAGQAMATAGSIAGGMGIPGAGQAGSLMQGAMQMAGQFASGLANVAASAGVGTIDQIGTQQTPSGVPLLPVVAPQQLNPLQSPDMQRMNSPITQGSMGRGPAIVNQYFGGIHTQNMDEWQRRQQLLERQQEQPLTNAYVH